MNLRKKFKLNDFSIAAETTDFKITKTYTNLNKFILFIYTSGNIKIITTRCEQNVDLRNAYYY